MTEKTREYLEWHRGKKIGVICEQCELLKFFEGEELFAKHGNYHVPSLRSVLAAELGCKRTENSFYDRCQLTFYYTHDEWAELNGYKRPDPPKGTMRAIGELEEWEGLIAICPGCRTQRTLDHRALRKRLGKSTVIASIEPRLKCQCGRRGARIVIGHMSR